MGIYTWSIEGNIAMRRINIANSAFLIRHKKKKQALRIYKVALEGTVLQWCYVFGSEFSDMTTEERITGIINNSDKIMGKRFQDALGHYYDYCQSYGKFLCSGQKVVNDYISSRIPVDRKRLFDITRNSHYTGGGPNQVWIRCVVYEK